MSSDGEFDMDSSVYCTELMGGYDDPVTGWTDGGAGGERQKHGALGLGGVFGRIKNKNKASSAKSHAPSASSAAASIALASNNYDDDDDDDESSGAENLKAIDEATVQTKTNVFLSYAVSGLDDGMSTVAPAEETNGGRLPNSTIAATCTAATARHQQQVEIQGGEQTVVDSSLSESLGSSNIHSSNNSSSSPEAIGIAPQSNKSPTIDGPVKPTSNRRAARTKRGSSGNKNISSSTTDNKKKRCWTSVAIAMLLVGLSAVVLGVLYGMGVIDLDGNGQGIKASAEGQACSRAGLCGDGDDSGNTSKADEPETPIITDSVPTDRPTAPPVVGDTGDCATHEQKSQSCGANNPNHPVRCCPGLYCDNKYCIDPNLTAEHATDEKDTSTTATAKPTPSLTEEPTFEPTLPPNTSTPEPSHHPTSASPTKPPTPNIWISQPTAEQAAQGIVPPPGHFTYDPNDAQYGFSAWSNPQYSATTSVSLDGMPISDTGSLGRMDPDDLDGLEIVPDAQASPEYKFWSKHAWSIDPNKKASFIENACDSTAYWGEGNEWKAEQSPIDVYTQSGDIDETGEETGVPGSIVEPRCFEHHEIRIKPGQFPLESSRIQKQITGSQLRLVYPDPQFEADGSTLSPDSKLPLADFPHGWGGNMEALRVDVKIPSEHWLNGKEYAAEYQIYHLHHKRKKAPVISIMVDLHPSDKLNEHFQLALNEWQKLWEKDYLECELRKRKERRVTAGLFEAVKGWVDGSRDIPVQEQEYSTWLDEPPSEDAKFRRNLRAARKAQEESGDFWDPYKKDEIMRSIHFFGYAGSLTEPPCTEFLEWRILDTPMLISRQQLFQMKTLLFRHRSVETGCRISSNHYMGSVARRPLQPLNRRKVYRCTCRDFLADQMRDEILALEGTTADNATYTPKCNRREFRQSEATKPWLSGA